MNIQIQKLQSAMKRAGLDAFYIESEQSRRYLTGFKSSAGVLIVLPGAAYFFTDFRYIEAAREKIKDCEIALMDAELFKNILGILSSARTKNLGFEEDKISFGAFERLKTRLSPGGFLYAPSGGILSRQRMAKEDFEIEIIKKAQQINEKAFFRVLKATRTGMTEKELAAELEYAMKKEGGDTSAFPTIALAGKNTSRPHGEPGDHRIESGRFVTMDFGCMLDGYCSDMTRTVAVGGITSKMQRVYDTVLGAMQRAFEVIRAGKTGMEIDAAARDFINRSGYEGKFGHSLGHSVGVDIHEEPSFSPGFKGEIPKNAVISVEPGIYLAGEFGVRIEDLVVVGEDGFKNLNSSPKELIVL